MHSIVLLAALSLTNSIAKIENPARITADRTFYDHIQNLVVFSGNVKVEDDETVIHAAKAVLAMNETNSINRVVALGGVALTNGTRRAYGEKLSYRSSSNLAILYAPSNGVAKVIDENPEGEDVVQGRKLRFWTDSQQVEVVDAELSRPDSGMISL